MCDETISWSYTGIKSGKENRICSFFQLHQLCNFLLKRTPKFSSQHKLLHNPQVHLPSTRHSQEQSSGPRSPLSRQDTKLRRSTAAALSGHGIAAFCLNAQEHLPPASPSATDWPWSTAFRPPRQTLGLQGVGACKALSLPQSPQ